MSNPLHEDGCDEKAMEKRMCRSRDAATGNQHRPVVIQIYNAFVSQQRSKEQIKSVKRSGGPRAVTFLTYYFFTGSKLTSAFERFVSHTSNFAQYLTGYKIRFLQLQGSDFFSSKFLSSAHVKDLKGALRKRWSE